MVIYGFVVDKLLNQFTGDCIVDNRWVFVGDTDKRGKLLWRVKINYKLIRFHRVRSIV